MSDHRKAFKNLKKYDKKTQKLVLELYNEVSDTLKELIPDNSMQLREANRILMREYDKALKSTDFIAQWQTATVNTIVASTYTVETGLNRKGWGEYLLDKSMFKDKKKLSKRIRENSYKIERDQRKILRESLKAGKSVAQIVGNIAEDNLKGFKRELPEYLDDIRRVSVAGKKISPKQITALRKRVSSIKTKGLRADYNKLIKAIELGKGVDDAVYFAMERRTKYYAERLARSETIRTIAVVDNHIAVQDPDTQWVKNITQGSNACSYCLAVSNLGFVPVANATIATHHPNCSCSSEYKKSIKRPKKWSNDTYESRLQTEINKENKKAERKGRSKTYQAPETPVNLRSNDLLSDLPS